MSVRVGSQGNKQTGGLISIPLLISYYSNYQINLAAQCIFLKKSMELFSIDTDCQQVSIVLGGFSHISPDACLSAFKLLSSYL